MIETVDKLRKIAELFGVEITELMDKYKLLPYHSPGTQITAQKEVLGISFIQW